jgi:hypothetical protein
MNLWISSILLHLSTWSVHVFFTGSYQKPQLDYIVLKHSDAFLRVWSLRCICNHFKTRIYANCRLEWKLAGSLTGLRGLHCNWNGPWEECGRHWECCVRHMGTSPGNVSMGDILNRRSSTRTCLQKRHVIMNMCPVETFFLSTPRGEVSTAFFPAIRTLPVS